MESHVVFACPGQCDFCPFVSTATVSHVRPLRSLAVMIVSLFIFPLCTINRSLVPLAQSLPHCQQALWLGGGVCSQTVVPNRSAAVELDL